MPWPARWSLKAKHLAVRHRTNAARNHIRRELTGADHVDIDELNGGLETPEHDPELLAEQRDLPRRVSMELERCNPELRRTFMAVVDECRSYSHAAAHLGIPIGTVRSRMAAVRQHLRPLLDCASTARQALTPVGRDS